MNMETILNVREIGLKANVAMGKVALTGIADRSTVNELLQSKSAVVGTNVDKETTLLIYGEEFGSRYYKAKKLRIRMISEKEFIKLFAN